MKMFYEKDTDVNLIKDKKIAIFGYGSQGHAHALNLKDSGVKEVVVALRDGSSSIPKAKSKGLKVMNLSDAAEWADVVMILTPDELQASIYKNHIEQRVRKGTSIAFAHGLNVHYDLYISIPNAILGCDVEIPTISGKAKIKILRAVQSGKILRLKKVIE